MKGHTNTISPLYKLDLQNKILFSKPSTSIVTYIFIQVRDEARYRLKSVSKKISQCYYAARVYIPSNYVILQKLCA